jgi:hypothetical protein
MVMGRKAVFLASILLIVLVPVLGGAQNSLIGMGLPSLGLPSLGGFFGRSSCTPGCAVPGGLKVFGGYVDDPRAVSLTFDPLNDGYLPAILLVNWKQQYPLRGWLVGLNLDIPLGESLYASLDGAYMFRGGPLSHSEEIVFFALGTGSRTWDALNQWYMFDVAGHYSPLGMAWAVAGVRFDSFATNFKNPTNQVALAALPTDEADVNLALWLPYLGLETVLRQTNGSLKVGFIGFPAVFGNVKYGQTYGAGGGLGLGARNEISNHFSRGYFLETYVEATLIPGANSALGLFVKYNYLDARGNMPGFFHSVGVFPTQTDVFQFNFHRTAWIFGANLNLNFDMPY